MLVFANGYYSILSLLKDIVSIVKTIRIYFLGMDEKLKVTAMH